jgi:hypothetical protein
MKNAALFASVLSRISPEAFDAIFPHGPVLKSRFGAGRGAEVSSDLNPQPLPPGERLVLASAEVARHIAFAAISAEAGGQDGAARIVSAAIDDWCGNGRPPIPIPWPGPWPFPFALDALPRDLDVVTSRVVGALSLAAVASRVAPGRVHDALEGGAERLLDAALGATSKQAGAASR